MNLSDKWRSTVSKIEIIVAVILFFVMLVSCGLYIDIKLNGKISNLPSLSENDKKMLEFSSVSESVSYDDDLLEPIFVGFKDDSVMSAVLPSDEMRRTVEENIYETLGLLFSGKNSKIEFDSQKELMNYLERKKYGSSYMLIGFYGDLPSSAVLPCIVDDYRVSSTDDAFLFKYLFILPDKNGNAYACAVSENYDIRELFPNVTIRFDKILNESYDISDGWSEFEYSEAEMLYPVLTSSFYAENYCIESLPDVYGKDAKQEWIINLFDVFSFNSNLVKNFSSGDGSEINYVEESRELVINDGGVVEFKTSDAGLLLSEFFGSAIDVGESVAFSDKIFALKSVINRLNISNSGVSYSLVGINYDEGTDSLKVYFKYMNDGVFIFDSQFDAMFEVRGNALVYAKFMAFNCIGTETYSVVMPQKYAVLTADDNDSYLLLRKGENTDIYSVVWANSSKVSEVNG